MNAILVFIKYPTAGKVKTRLGARIGFELAARLYRGFLEQTFHLCQEVKNVDRIFAVFAPRERAQAFRELVPGCFSLFPQEGLDLGRRLQNAFSRVFGCGANHVVAIGSDSPTLRPEVLTEAFEQLRQYDLVLGPAEDGGYYLIGQKQVNEELFADVEWSSNSVFQKTLDKAEKAELTTFLLPKWYDVDDIDALQRAAADERGGPIRKLLLEQAEDLL